jgi:hypothetical protein
MLFRTILVLTSFGIVRVSPLFITFAVKDFADIAVPSLHFHISVSIVPLLFFFAFIFH